MMDRLTFRRLSIGVWIFIGQIALASSEVPKLTAELSSSRVVNGSIVLVTVRVSPDAQSTPPQGKFEELRFPFYKIGEKDSQIFQAVLGIPFYHQPGVTKVEIEHPASRSLELALTVEDGQYPSEKLKVPKKMVKPPQITLQRIRREQQEVKKIYQQMTQEKYWNGRFTLPIQSSITSVFGTKRVYNGQLNNFHGGVDLKASVGTPIHAPAAGVVVMAKDLYYTGNTVFLDHGYGIFTVYAHLSQLDVKPGQRVNVNSLIGLSGKTGRVNGPHLHWQAIVHQTKVNPIDLTRILQ